MRRYMLSGSFEKTFLLYFLPSYFNMGVEKVEMKRESFLNETAPMGIYETLYAFWDAFGSYMGSEGSHPWSQGFPLTTKLPNGPPLPTHVDITSDDLFYPKAWGHPKLRNAIAGYYNKFYGCSLVPENIMIYAGGRPALIAIMTLLRRDIEVTIASTEYTPYVDMLKCMNLSYSLVDSNKANNFLPESWEYFEAGGRKKIMPLMSNPCNPTGITRAGQDLADFVAMAEGENMGALIDEAYEMMRSPPVSALSYIKDLDNSNFFITGAATKGLQCPGIRIGWCIASRQNILTLANFSSFGMGGVSHPSQLYAVKLFDPARIEIARKAVPEHYDFQRNRYGKAFEAMGIKLWSGDGGFYHWCELPEGLTCEELNKRLFVKGAAVLRGTDGDMRRPIGPGIRRSKPFHSSLKRFFRFSFGPLSPESFEDDIKLLREVLNEYKKSAGLCKL